MVRHGLPFKIAALPIVAAALIFDAACESSDAPGNRTAARSDRDFAANANGDPLPGEHTERAAGPG